MERKPPEVKLMNDYSTGHCKVLNIIKFWKYSYNNLIQVCEAAKQNFEALVKAAKKSCVCATKVRRIIIKNKNKMF